MENNNPSSSKLVKREEVVVVCAGQEALIASNHNDIVTGVVSDGLARRKSTFSRFKREHLMQSDFSLLSLACISPLMNAFFKANDKNSLMVKEKIVKFTIAFSLVTTDAAHLRADCKRDHANA